MLPRTVVRSAVLALLAGFCATPLEASQAGSDVIHVKYDVSLIGLPIGAAKLVGEVSPTAYNIEASATLSGLAAVISSSRGAANASGAIVSGHVSPAAYATTAANSQMTRTVRMALAGNAVTGLDISPPIEERPDRVPLRDQDKRGVLDPVSAIVISAPGAGPLTGPAACERVIPVFDGATRFDVKLSYTGQRNVKATGYSGPVAVCAARYVPIAGHRPNRPATKFMVDNKQMEVWLAPVGSERVLMPFRVSVRTMLGSVVIEASEFIVEAKN